MVFFQHKKSRNWKMCDAYLLHHETDFSMTAANHVLKVTLYICTLYPTDTSYVNLCITEIEDTSLKWKWANTEYRKEKSPLSLGYFDSGPQKSKKLVGSLNEIDVYGEKKAK